MCTEEIVAVSKKYVVAIRQETTSVYWKSHYMQLLMTIQRNRLKELKANLKKSMRLLRRFNKSEESQVA